MSYADAAAKGPKQAPEDVSVSGIYKDESESTASLIDVDSPHVQAVDPDFLNQEVQTTTQAERLEREAEEKERERAREDARKKAKSRKVQSSGLSANSGNPVYIGNAVVMTLVGAGLGFGAYRQHVAGKLSWELVGLVSGAVGAFGVVDYYVSK
ncbi:hypothetical protein N7533_013214 [Penicillium manginii]|uniref:uncharacterized protein n=1 Tax=Penicillium manginii TaxID=203109 RepID=UPI0025490005|nr:uncharacterized protein N7533_013214 [Penicillium manginii]KAJ5734811.1 hypothetical protein N7533_013214 [Penicillium manginii]